MSKFLYENSKSKKRNNFVKKNWRIIYPTGMGNENENSKSKKGQNCVKNEGLPPLLVWVSLLIVNNYSEFQVAIFSNNRDIWKCQSFCTTPPTTTTGLWQYLDVFFDNSRANDRS